MFEHVTGKLNGRGGNFAWKTLPTLLVKCGCVLHNYPDNTLMPGEGHTTLRQSKGVHDLTLPSRDPIIHSEPPGAESNHLHGCRQFANCHIDWKGLPCLCSPASSAASSAAPSPAPSTTAPSCCRSQRLQRLQVPSQVSSSVPSRRPKCHMFMEVPLPPPSWRLIAPQQALLHNIPACNTSELIPDIVSLTQITYATIETDATVKADATVNQLDGLLGSQEN
ncbi:hypothetical protein EDB19DRAFT_1822933 [Suillus lakei]|nr:hypothetical protein EDB19DRAFT_1822933 [Suillus lakei]